jgi:hypothetical protein
MGSRVLWGVGRGGRFFIIVQDVTGKAVWSWGTCGTKVLWLLVVA